VGQQLGLIDEDRFALCWIVDFPFYEEGEEPGSIDFATTPSPCRRAGSRR
jgi:aspartyl-tRNA synthetase